MFKRVGSVLLMQWLAVSVWFVLFGHFYVLAHGHGVYVAWVACGLFLVASAVAGIFLAARPVPPSGQEFTLGSTAFAFLFICAGNALAAAASTQLMVMAGAVVGPLTSLGAGFWVRRQRAEAPMVEVEEAVDVPETVLPGEVSFDGLENLMRNLAQARAAERAAAEREAKVMDAPPPRVRRPAPMRVGQGFQIGPQLRRRLRRVGRFSAGHWAAPGAWLAITVMVLLCEDLSVGGCSIFAQTVPRALLIGVSMGVGYYLGYNNGRQDPVR